MTQIRYLRTAIAAIGLTVLIVDSQCAIQGAVVGLDLCIKNVIPSLFPFFILSMMLTNSLDCSKGRLVRFMTGIMEIPHQAASVLIPAFLGGYPVGAKCAADLYSNGVIKKQEAERLLSFCSNAGPSFMFGMISAFFPDKGMVFCLWSIHVLSAVLTGMIFSDQTRESAGFYKQQISDSRQDLMLSALKAMAAVCGWIVVMRTLIEFLNVWILSFLPEWLQVFIIGVLELSNGCCELLRIQNVSRRFLLCSCMLALGGVGVLLQTMSVTKGLSLRNYIRGKMLQTVIAFFLSSIFIWKKSFLYMMVVSVFLGLIIKIKNICRNPEGYPV